jgi:transposase
MNYLPTYAVLIGLDWGHRRHAFALWEESGRRVSGEVEHIPEKLHQWITDLQGRFPNRPIAVAVETNRGPIIHALMEHPGLTLYPIHPATSARFRRAFTPSGAKDDGPDAHDLLELLEHHRDKLRPLVPQDELTRRLSGLVEARRKAVDRRTALLNALTAALRGYFPQALTLVGENLASPLALDLFDRWPDLLSLQTARLATLRRFFYLHNVRRPECVEERIAKVRSAVALTRDPAVVAVGRAEVACLVAQLRVLQKHIAQFEADIAAAFKAHPQAGLFGQLPGAGPTLAPRLLVAFGTDRSRYPEAAALQKYSGIAPVREKSGDRVWIHWRWRAPRFLRQTFHEWAGQTVVWCPWAKAYYQQQLQKGKKHHAILRALAFKWIRILWKCWVTHTPYDEARYLAALARRTQPAH